MHNVHLSMLYMYLIILRCLRIISLGGLTSKHRNSSIALIHSEMKKVSGPEAFR